LYGACFWLERLAMNEFLGNQSLWFADQSVIENSISCAIGGLQCLWINKDEALEADLNKLSENPTADRANANQCDPAVHYSL